MPRATKEVDSDQRRCRLTVFLRRGRRTWRSAEFAVRELDGLAASQEVEHGGEVGGTVDAARDAHPEVATPRAETVLRPRRRFVNGVRRDGAGGEAREGAQAANARIVGL